MINKYYEISCDGCGCADHYTGSIWNTERQWRKLGGVITKDKKHYCDSSCKKNADGEVK